MDFMRIIDGRRHRLLVAAVFLLAICIRLLFITADPPVPLPADGAFYTDQGWYNHNAIHKINTGSWFLDVDRNEIAHTALFSFVQFVSFKMFGVHFWAAKLQPILFSLGTIALAYLFFARVAGPLSGLLMLGLLAVNYQHIVYSNLSLVEPTVTFFLVLAFMLWFFSRTNSVWNAAVCGVAVFLGLISKTHAVHFVFFLVLAIVYEFMVFSDKRERIRLVWRSILFVVVLFVCYAIWYKYWIEPNHVYWETFGAHIRRLPHNIPAKYGRYARRYVQAFLDIIYYGAVRTPILFALCTTACAIFVSYVAGGKRDFLRKHYVFSLCVLWISADLIFFIAARGARPRYQMMLIVPFVYCAVWIIVNGKSFIRASMVKGMNLWGIMVPAMLVLLWKAVQVKNPDPGLYVLGIAGLVALLYSVFLFRPASLLKKSSLVGLAAGYIALQLMPVGWWCTHKTYSICRIGSEIRSIMNANNDDSRYVLGALASTFALEGGFKTISGMNGRLFPDIHSQYHKIVTSYKPKYLLHNARNVAFIKDEFFKMGTGFEFEKEFIYKGCNSYSASPENGKLYLYRIRY